jgi:hypothetical protein
MLAVKNTTKVQKREMISQGFSSEAIKTENKGERVVEIKEIKFYQERRFLCAVY